VWILLLYGVFLAYFITVNLTYLVLSLIGYLANVRRAREVRQTDLRHIESSALTIPLSVIVPAYNEEVGTGDTVLSLLRSGLPEFEIIVVDDGSTDATLHRLVQEFDLVEAERPVRSKPASAPVRAVLQSRRDPRLWVVSKENGGKADAGNAGLAIVRYRYVLMTDADVIFHEEALTRMVRLINFDPGGIVGLGAAVRVMNGCEVEAGRITSCRLPREWLVRFQVVEYGSAFLAARVGWSELNAVPVVSGAAAVWRADALREIGGFSTDMTHEDLDITLRMHRRFRHADRRYRIVYLPDPVVWTEVPHEWRGIYNQRKRWQRTLFESMWHERDMCFNPRYGTVGMLQMPYLMLYEAIGPFIEAASYIVTIVLLVLGLLDVRLLAAFLVVAAGLTAVVRLVSLAIDLLFYEDRPLRDVLLLGASAILEFWIYRPFLLIARIHAFFEFLRGDRGYVQAARKERAPTAADA
jgi:cellulose synthase/poly-beta-1,6-N-acetylglucosamine synthase-like glycosyltransferase